MGQQKSKQVQGGNRPWRTFDAGGNWDSPEYEQSLIRMLTTKETDRAKAFSSNNDVKHPRVLLIGKLGAGKTSFIKSAESIYKRKFQAAEWTKSTTQQLTDTFIPELGLTFVDTRGLSNTNDVILEDIPHLLRGHCRQGYKFKTDAPMAQCGEYWNREPSLADRIHCVVFVVDAYMIASLSYTDTFFQHIGRVKSYVREQNVPCVVLLTKIDQVGQDIKENIKHAYINEDLDKAVCSTSTHFGVEEMHIFPIINYTTQSGTDINMNILLLLALQRISQLADNFITVYKSQQVQS